jgi:hypothetical protein
MKIYKLLMIYPIIILILLIKPVNSEQEEMSAVVTTSSGWTSGAHSVVSGYPVNGHRTVQNKILPTISDLSISAHGAYFYRIERFQADNIAKFDISNPGTAIWNVPACLENEPNLQSYSANPYAMVFASNEKAYLIRYGARTAWIVNPSVSFADRAQFQIGLLDLSGYANENGQNSYDDTDGYPEMCAGIIVHDKLFIVMQRLVDFCPDASVHSYVAVFDIKTDTEIDTQKGEGSLKGIRLPSPVYNAGYAESSSVSYLEDTGLIYISGAASFGFCSNGVGGKGGVVSIDPDTFETKVVLDGNMDTWKYGNVSSIAVAASDKAYFLSIPDPYSNGLDNSLQVFHPISGEVYDEIGSFHGKNIWSMYLDRSQKLWLCNVTDAEIVIIDTLDNSIEERVATEPAPKLIAFVYKNDIDQTHYNPPDEPFEDTSLSLDSEDSGIGGCFVQLITGKY